VLYEEWISTDGASAKGNWKNVGGTGKFARAANTGQWESPSCRERWEQSLGSVTASSLFDTWAQQRAEPGAVVSG
jgi:hypothetical protein